ncbi:MAG: hypothetical protein HY234_05195 [Acidobacteria bacterium]|nr:hypothetical protein [Acidobacteriota bacterium]MBI3662429.1 hypothetical protein [Acidobacteriota bacterium]
MRNHLLAILISAALIPGLTAPLRAGDEKLKPEDVVAKHLASLGAPEKRAAVKTRVAEGASTLKIIVGGTGETDGRAAFLSEGNKVRIGLPTDKFDYWGEQFGFDGSKTEVAFVQPSRRSQLGDFVRRYDQILKEGLVGGALTTAWPLLDLAGRQPKLSYDGLKKVDGKQLHRIKYVMKKGQGEVDIYLYFEPETFRHVRTSYNVVRSSPIGADITQSSQQQETRFLLEEIFSDFKEVDGVTLPMSWTLKQTNQTGQRTIIAQHEVKLSRVSHNVAIPAKDFVIELRAK